MSNASDAAQRAAGAAEAASIAAAEAKSAAADAAAAAALAGGNGAAGSSAVGTQESPFQGAYSREDGFQKSSFNHYATQAYACTSAQRHLCVGVQLGLFARACVRECAGTFAHADVHASRRVRRGIRSTASYRIGSTAG